MKQYILFNETVCKFFKDVESSKQDLTDDSDSETDEQKREKFDFTLEIDGNLVQNIQDSMDYFVDGDLLVPIPVCELVIDFLGNYSIYSLIYTGT